MERIIERLTRLEEKADAQREDIAEIKSSLKEVERRVNNLHRMVYALWIVGTAGIGLVVELIRTKVKTAFGGHA